MYVAALITFSEETAATGPALDILRFTVRVDADKLRSILPQRSRSTRTVAKTEYSRLQFAFASKSPRTTKVRNKDGIGWRCRSYPK